MMKKLSVIVPVYKVEKYIRPCIESILGQGLCEDDYEIIIVNDGTPDKSMEVVADLISSHSNIVVVEQANQGLSVARNTGLKHATGQYVMFCDSDDLLVRGALSEVLDAAMSEPADMVMADFVKINDGENCNVQSEPLRPENIRRKSNLLAFHEDFYPGECYVWRYLFSRSFLLDNNICFVPGLYYEDIPYTHECFVKAHSCLRVKHAIYIYRRRGDSISTKPNIQSLFDINSGIAIVKSMLEHTPQPEPVRRKIYYSLYLLLSSHLWRIVHVFERKQDAYAIIDDLKRKLNGGYLTLWLGKTYFLFMTVHFMPHRLVDYYYKKKQTMKQIDKIDFVITWVNGQDPKWQKDYDYYLEKETGKVDNRVERYRNWDNLRYWFRGVEKFAPWVNKIFFVTCGHLPSWLDTTNPKLVVVKHSDYIPAEYLPTFNSNVIEIFFHRIKGLSEHFVYFNDDIFLINDVKPERFFRHGLPCDTEQMSVNRSQGIMGSSVYMAIDLINRHFNKWECIHRHPRKWYSASTMKALISNVFFRNLELFPGFLDHHLSEPLLKSVFDDAWDKCGDELSKTATHRFREYGDVAFWLIRYWQLASCRFTPANVTKGTMRFVSGINDQSIDEIVDCIAKQRVDMLLLNDCSREMNFERNKQMLLAAFDRILPEKCSFEI